MKRFLLMLALLVGAVGCGQTDINVPVALRQHNYGRRWNGSCMHASLATAMRAQGYYEMAEWWLDHHKGGSGYGDLPAKLDAAGIDYEMTHDEDDVGFLERSISSGRGCVVAVNGYTHAVFLCRLDSETVGLIGPNFPQSVTYVPRAEFLQEWHASHSFAVTVIYCPAPPQ